jgi:hypothetical protein
MLMQRDRQRIEEGDGVREPSVLDQQLRRQERERGISGIGPHRRRERLECMGVITARPGGECPTLNVTRRRGQVPLEQIPVIMFALHAVHMLYRDATSEQLARGKALDAIALDQCPLLTGVDAHQAETTATVLGETGQEGRLSPRWPSPRRPGIE